jgi:hypothetical protein
MVGQTGAAYGPDEVQETRRRDARPSGETHDAGRLGRVEHVVLAADEQRSGSALDRHDECVGRDGRSLRLEGFGISARQAARKDADTEGDRAEQHDQP